MTSGEGRDSKAQVVSGQPLTAKAWVHSQSSPVQSMFDLWRKVWDLDIFSPRTSAFPCQYQPTNAPLTFIMLATESVVK